MKKFFQNIILYLKVFDENRKLRSANFDLEHDLFEAQQFGRIAEEKLTLWVKKHDELLLEYKEYKKTHGN